MKLKNLLASLLLTPFLYLKLYSQAQPRNFFLDVSSNSFYNSKKTSLSTLARTTSAYAIESSIGYNFNNRIGVGVNLGYLNQPDLIAQSNVTSVYEGKLAGVFLRNYIVHKERLQIFLNLAQTFESYEIGVVNTYYYNNGNYIRAVDRQNIFDMSSSLSFGLNYFITNHFALQLKFGKLSYNYFRQSNTIYNSQYYSYNIPQVASASTTTNNNFNLDMTLSSASLGLLFSFGKLIEDKQSNSAKKDDYLKK